MATRGRVGERRKKPYGESFYSFEWLVDRDGYDIVAHESNDVIRARGGARRVYRPMEDEPGLWREFAETCTSAESALAFTTKFGDLTKFDTLDTSEPDTPVEKALLGAKLIRHIAGLIESKRLPEAIEFFKSETNAKAQIWIDGNGELRPYPVDLLSALLIQTGEALTHNRSFVCCQNPRCSTWFRVGTGASTIRRKFCSDRCRVAVDRARHAAGSVDRR